MGKASALRNLLADLMGSDDTESDEMAEDLRVKSRLSRSIAGMEWSRSAEIPRERRSVEINRALFVNEERTERSISSSVSHDDPDDLLFDFSSLVNDLAKAKGQR